MSARRLDEDERALFHALLDEDDRSGRALRRRLWLAGILLTLIVVLFVADRYVTLVEPNIARMQSKRDLQSVRSLEGDVRTVLDSYGIKSEWIRERAVEFEGVGHIRDSWLVLVPHDLPIASLNLDLKAVVDVYGGKAFAVENSRLSQVAIHISFRGSIRYSLILTSTADVHRAGGDIVLLVDGLDNAPDREIRDYLASSEPIACVLAPNKDNVALHTRIRKAGKEVVLHLHFHPFGSGESRFELSEDLEDEQLAVHLRYIVRNFPGTQFYYITSERALGTYLRRVEEMMASYGYQGLESSTFSYLDRSARENVITARMNDLAATAIRQGTAIGVVELRDGIISFLHEEMGRLRKKGQNFVSLMAYSRKE
ncbi:MAG: hypothetical protein KFH87_06320 [Bacteroidetes bacterium]|nr:hypothetical protein [Bacteroidota bacterium]